MGLNRKLLGKVAAYAHSHHYVSRRCSDLEGAWEAAASAAIRADHERFDPCEGCTLSPVRCEWAAECLAYTANIKAYVARLAE
jgi:alkylhydroperoxidase family enzyme